MAEPGRLRPMSRFTVWVVLGLGVGVLACEGSVTLPERPRFEVVWPRPERYPDSTLVAEGHVLTVAGRVALPYYKPWGVWVYVEGRRVGEASSEAPGLVPRWDPDQFITFRVLVRDFGAVGTKDLVVRVCREGCGEARIPIRNDPALLEQKARAYARQYWSRVFEGRDYGTVRLAGNVISVVNMHPDPRVQEVLPEVVRWWELWCGGTLRFVLGGTGLPQIQIRPGTTTGATFLSPPTVPGPVIGDITLASDELRDQTLFLYLLHEMGHTLGLHHTHGYGGVMSDDVGEVRLQFNPVEQRACRLVYSHPPGTYF
jgi:hypothetical protein